MHPIKERTPKPKEPSPVPEPTSPVVKTLETPNQDTFIRKRCACQSHASILRKLHLRVCERPLPQETPTDHDSVFTMISTWVSQRQARRIVQALEQHLSQNTTQVTAFRASVVYSFTNETCFWPVIEWREGIETEAMAIFLVDNEGTVCSWLMHYGYGTNASEGGGRWRSTSISWCVGEIVHLKSLFEAAQHLLGILQWEPEDILDFYCNRNLGSGSEEQYFLLRCG